MKTKKKNQNSFANISKKMEGFLGLKEEEVNISSQKNELFLPLNKMDMKAFEGLCAMEKKSVKEKVTELLQDYIEEKRKLMEE